MNNYFLAKTLLKLRRSFEQYSCSYKIEIRPHRDPGTLCINFRVYIFNTMYLVQQLELSVDCVPKLCACLEQLYLLLSQSTNEIILDRSE